MVHGMSTPPRLRPLRRPSRRARRSLCDPFVHDPVVSPAVDAVVDACNATWRIPDGVAGVYANGRHQGYRITRRHPPERHVWIATRPDGTAIVVSRHEGPVACLHNPFDGTEEYAVSRAIVDGQLVIEPGADQVARALEVIVTFLGAVPREEPRPPRPTDPESVLARRR